ncbi:unnamed protein product [Caretta caretta]
MSSVSAAHCTRTRGNGSLSLPVRCIVGNWRGVEVSRRETANQEVQESQRRRDSGAAVFPPSPRPGRKQLKHGQND